jgi:adenylosuccinate lyase
MTIAQQVSEFKDLIQNSLENAMGTVERIHQTVIEMPIDVATELGLSQEQATRLKDGHRRILHTLYAGVASGYNDLGDLVVAQVTSLTEFAGGILEQLLAVDDSKPMPPTRIRAQDAG